MNSALMDRVKAALSSKHYSVNETWLRDCTAFYVEEHAETTLDPLLSFIISQWQLSDLREINNNKGCLPNNLGDKKSITLNGKYILQMDCIYDISTPKYKQLEKIKNISTENIEVTETDNLTQFNAPATQTNNAPFWEPKPKRMMHMKLTDGKQTITAIEHKSISLFNDLTKLLPGLKIMIIGPVVCRRGVLLLEDKNLVPVGGEVESLLIPNAIENVLARALKLEENPNPYSDDIESQNNINSDRMNDVNLNENSSNNLTNNSRSTNMNTQFSNNSKQQSTSNNLNTNSKPNSWNTVQQQPSVDDIFQDDFNDIDFTALDEDIKKKSQELNSTSTTRNENISQNMPTRSNNNVSRNNQNKNVKDGTYKSQPNKQKSPQINNYDAFFDELEILEIEKATAEWSEPEPPKIKNTQTNSTTSQNFKQSNLSNDVSTSHGQKPSTSEMNLENDVIDLTNDSWDSFRVPNPKLENSISSCDIVRQNPSKLPGSSNSSIYQENKFTNISMKPVKSKYENSGTNIAQKRSSSEISPPTESNPLKLRRSEETLKKKSERKITDFIKPKIANVPDDFFHLLCDVVKENLTNMPIKRNIRAKVTKLSKLALVDGKWSLNATLTDGTTNIDVDFSSQSLDKMFGFTVEEFKRKKKMKKQNPEILISLRQDIATAEQKLVKMDALVELELLKDTKAVVTKITQLTEEQKRIIDQRIASVKRNI